jgi:hypothetical protein
VLVLDTHDYFTHHQKHLRAMGPNIKLVEELVKQMRDQVREEIRESFSAHDSIINTRFIEFETRERQREQRVAALESAVSSFDKCLSEWKPKVDASLTSVKFELLKLNSFDREAKLAATPKSGVLQIGSTSAPPPTGVDTDGPAGHRVNYHHRDCGSGHLLAHSHDPVKGTVLPSPLQLTFPIHLESFHAVGSPRFFPNSESRVHMGKLPKLNFPNFENDNPKLWQTRCENYFEMYSVDPSVWVKVATMHFEGPAVRWLQSVQRRVNSAFWKELCSWIHERFGRDQHEILIRQLFHIRQSTTVQDYIDRFTELVN